MLYKIPFCSNGDKQEIQDNKVNDLVSFTEGYNSCYSLDPTKDKKGIYVDRLTFNYLSNVITDNLMKHQRETYPQWVSGVSYLKNSIVKYKDINYESIIWNNTNEPTDNPLSGWVTLGTGYFPIGSVIKWVGSAIPIGYAECNGASFDVDKYPKLAALLPDGKLPDLTGRALKGVKAGKPILVPESGAVGIHDHAFTTELSKSNHVHDLSKMKSIGNARGLPLIRCKNYDNSIITCKTPARQIVITLPFDNPNGKIRLSDLVLDSKLISDKYKDTEITDTAGEHQHKITIDKNAGTNENRVDSVTVKYLVRMD